MKRKNWQIEVRYRCEEGVLPDDTCTARSAGEQSSYKMEIASGKKQGRPRNDITNEKQNFQVEHK